MYALKLAEISRGLVKNLSSSTKYVLHKAHKCIGKLLTVLRTGYPVRHQTGIRACIGIGIGIVGVWSKVGEVLCVCGLVEWFVDEGLYFGSGIEFVLHDVEDIVGASDGIGDVAHELYYFVVE